jgi:hypothetical protein
MLLFAIRDRRPDLVPTPSLLRIAAGRLGGDPDSHRLLSESQVLTWTAPNSCVLKERRSYRASTPALARAFGAYGKRQPAASQDVGGGAATSDYFINFSAEATCKITPRGRFRIVRIRPGAFD